MKHLVQNWDQFNYFVEQILPPLFRDEVYFVSLSARKKYLTPEEREKYQLSQTEMYARKAVRSKDKLQFVMNELSAIFSIRQTKSGQPMPEKANVVYININPSSMMKATNAFIADMNRETAQIVNGLMAGGEPNFLALQYADRKLMNHIQKNTGTRTYLDVDVDSLENSHLVMLISGLDHHQIEYYVIETHGGFHVLINRNDLNDSDLRLHEEVKKLDSFLKPLGKECIFNSNGMVPVPGTLQAGKLVTVKGRNDQW